MITSRRLKTRWETRAPWTGAIVIPVLSASRTHRGQRYASDFCCALPRTAARRSKAATGAATASSCSLQLGLARGCSGAASRRRGRIYRSTREDSTTNGPRQQTRPRRVVVSNAADYKIYVAAVMRSFQQVLASSEHIWYGANTLPPANLVWFAIKEVLSPQALRSTTGCQSSACPRELLVPRTCSLFWTRHRRELARYLGLLDGVDYY